MLFFNFLANLSYLEGQYKIDRLLNGFA